MGNAIEAPLNGVSAAPVTQAAKLPELSSKQQLDLNMLTRGEVTVDQIKARPKRGEGLPPKPMADGEIKAYLNAIEAHLNGVSAATVTQAAKLPELSSTQQLDLNMLKRVEVTVDQIKARLKRGEGLPPKPMADGEIKAYLSAIEAHLNGVSAEPVAQAS